MPQPWYPWLLPPLENDNFEVGIYIIYYSQEQMNWLSLSVFHPVFLPRNIVLAESFMKSFSTNHLSFSFHIFPPFFYTSKTTRLITQLGLTPCISPFGCGIRYCQASRYGRLSLVYIEELMLTRDFNQSISLESRLIETNSTTWTHEHF